jgi:hypothetical protein
MTNITGSKLSIFSHPGKITVIGLLQGNFHIESHIGPGQYGPRLHSQNSSKYRLIHGHFHIGLVIILRFPYWPETESRANMGRGILTRPIWKCPCIKLFKVISISSPILARANMDLDFISGQYGPLLHLRPIWVYLF